MRDVQITVAMENMIFHNVQECSSRLFSTKLLLQLTRLERYFAYFAKKKLFCYVQGKFRLFLLLNRLSE